MKPIIGLTMSKDLMKGYHSLNNYYMDAVFSAGGIPINVPIVENEKNFEYYLNIIDGLILTGGDDIWPLLYDENPLKETHIISSKRDYSEIGLFKKAYEMKLPVLGICRGLQVMNVALGGDLYQDINIQIQDSLGHQPIGISEDELYHSIDINKETDLYDIFKSERIFINSNHHQSIKNLGNNLIASAFSEDGIIEAIESNDDRFLIGLQFHPECLIKRYPEFLKLFEQLVAATKL